MARTLLQAVLNTLQSSGATQGMLDAPFVASDPTNFNNFTATGRDHLTIFNADVPSTGTITNVAVASGVLTLTAVNHLVKGQNFTVTGVGTATFLNSQTYTVVTATPTVITASISHGDYVSASDTGTITASGAAHTFTLHSFIDPQGRTADVTAYSIPAGQFASFWIPSSALFTQTDGTVWIDCNNAALQLLLTH